MSLKGILCKSADFSDPEINPYPANVENKVSS